MHHESHTPCFLTELHTDCGMHDIPRCNCEQWQKYFHQLATQNFAEIEGGMPSYQAIDLWHLPSCPLMDFFIRLPLPVEREWNAEFGFFPYGIDDI